MVGGTSGMYKHFSTKWVGVSMKPPQGRIMVARQLTVTPTNPSVEEQYID